MARSLNEGPAGEADFETGNLHVCTGRSSPAFRILFAAARTRVPAVDRIYADARAQRRSESTPTDRSIASAASRQVSSR